MDFHFLLQVSVEAAECIYDRTCHWGTQVVYLRMGRDSENHPSVLLNMWTKEICVKPSSYLLYQNKTYFMKFHSVCWDDAVKGFELISAPPVCLTCVRIKKWNGIIILCCTLGLFCTPECNVKSLISKRLKGLMEEHRKTLQDIKYWNMKYIFTAVRKGLNVLPGVHLR